MTQLVGIPVMKNKRLKILILLWQKMSNYKIILKTEKKKNSVRQYFSLHVLLLYTEYNFVARRTKLSNT